MSNYSFSDLIVTLFCCNNCKVILSNWEQITLGSGKFRWTFFCTLFDVSLIKLSKEFDRINLIKVISGLNYGENKHWLQPNMQSYWVGITELHFTVTFITQNLKKQNHLHRKNNIMVVFILHFFCSSLQIDYNKCRFTDLLVCPSCTVRPVTISTVNTAKLASC